MANNDNGITIETLNLRIDGIDKRLATINRRLESIDKNLTSVGYELRYNTLDTAHLQTSVYWSFAVIAVIVALVGFVIALAPMLRDIYKENRKPALSEEKVQMMIDNAVNKAVNKALILRQPN